MDGRAVAGFRQKSRRRLAKDGMKDIGGDFAKGNKDKIPGRHSRMGNDQIGSVHNRICC